MPARLCFLRSVAAALLGIAVLGMAACLVPGTGATLPDPQGPGEEAPPPEDIVSGIGTLRYVGLEGGFYGLVADDSTRYVPQDLARPYRQDGMRVRFRGVTQDSAATMQMWGTPLELLDIMTMNDSPAGGR